ncbi:hypothetical protein PHLCEN_2v9129, partial [Hermanssonia centrifuga]
YLPTYYQACKSASPTRSGVEIFGLCMTLGPCVIVTGASIAITKKYRVQLWIGWTLLTLAMGIMSTMHADTPLAQCIGYPVLVGIGAGIIYSATYFPVLAPLPVSENAHALAFFAFCRSFAGVWGVTIGATVLQTQLSRRLPPAFLAQFPGGVAISYSAIPVISSLLEPAQSEVREAFAQSIIVIWQVMIGISCIGLLSCFGMKALPLHTEVDGKWGLHTEQINAIPSEPLDPTGSESKRSPTPPQIPELPRFADFGWFIIPEGTDNREAAVCLCGCQGQNHFEVRFVDGTANPLVLPAFWVQVRKLF